MRTSIWYSSVEKQPDNDGYYLTYRGWGMGGKADDDHDHGYLYYYKKHNKWYEYEGAWNSSFPDVVSFVYYWTDADPAGWTDEDPPSVKIKQGDSQQHVALQDAWKDVQEALKKYETIKALLDEY